MTEFIITCPSELDADGHYRIDRWKELIRCKDCKHYDGDENSWLGTCLENGVCSTPDWFCADGEMKESNGR